MSSSAPAPFVADEARVAQHFEMVREMVGWRGRCAGCGVWQPDRALQIADADFAATTAQDVENLEAGGIGERLEQVRASARDVVRDAWGRRIAADVRCLSVVLAQSWRRLSPAAMYHGARPCCAAPCFRRRRLPVGWVPVAPGVPLMPGQLRDVNGHRAHGVRLIEAQGQLRVGRLHGWLGREAML